MGYFYLFGYLVYQYGMIFISVTIYKYSNSKKFIGKTVDRVFYGPYILTNVFLYLEIFEFILFITPIQSISNMIKGGSSSYFAILKFFAIKCGIFFFDTELQCLLRDFLPEFFLINFSMIFFLVNFGLYMLFVTVYNSFKHSRKYILAWIFHDFIVFMYIEASSVIGYCD
jgi:hypothetical protein